MQSSKHTAVLIMVQRHAAFEVEKNYGVSQANFAFDLKTGQAYLKIITK